MADTDDLESGEEAAVTLEEKQSAAAFKVLDAARGAGWRDDKSLAVIEPLLRHEHQDGRDDNHPADMQTAADVADPKTSVPHELESAGGDQRSVRSSCSDSSRHECHICSERFDSHTLLRCNHALCQDCVAGVMKRAKDPGRLRCPFCRQTTPFPQWEIRRLQEEFYSNCVYEETPALVVGPGPGSRVTDAPPGCACRLVRRLKLVRFPSRCFSIAVLLLLFLVLLGCSLYTFLPI